jgi:hypothetical protein
VTRQRADRDVVARITDVRETTDLSDVDQHARLRRDGAVSAERGCDRLRSSSRPGVLPDEADGLLRRAGAT